MGLPEDPSLSTTHDLSLEARQARGRIWVDGCFDFVHHGHAGAMLQARQLGTALYIGVHSDEAITVNKGPPVMGLDEREAAVNACRWATAAVPHAPYVTELDYIDKWNTRYVVHGDDITSDADGNDTYRFVKQAGRFLVVKRTPGISTTDLVARMLAEPAPPQAPDSAKPLPYHVASLQGVLSGTEACASGSGAELLTRITAYATDESGLEPGVPVFNWTADAAVTHDAAALTPLVSGPLPRLGQRIVYVDGGWDLFCSGHIAFLQAVADAENNKAKAAGWFDDARKAARIRESGFDYAPSYIVVGVHTDQEVHAAKGGVFPVMSIFERGLCVLQCRDADATKYISGMVFSAPRVLSSDFLHAIGALSRDRSGMADQSSCRFPDIVYHGPTASNTALPQYEAAAALRIFNTIVAHQWQDVHAETIVQRILENRAKFEERQRIKEGKKVGEEEIRRGEGW